MLVSGDHSRVARFRRRQALARTLAVRPDLIEKLDLDEEERAWLSSLERERAEGGTQADDGPAPAGPMERCDADEGD